MSNVKDEALSMFRVRVVTEQWINVVAGSAEGAMHIAEAVARAEQPHLAAKATNASRMRV